MYFNMFILGAWLVIILNMINDGIKCCIIRLKKVVVRRHIKKRINNLTSNLGLGMVIAKCKHCGHREEIRLSDVMSGKMPKHKCWKGGDDE